MASAYSTAAVHKGQGNEIMAILAHERKVYEEMRHQLEATHLGKWVLIRDGDFIGIYDGFEAAAMEAVRRFGRGPYLIREIGSPDVTLPASVVYAAMQQDA
jgi:hypothetical protein